jgi:hypothetical protein
MEAAEREAAHLAVTVKALLHSWARVLAQAVREMPEADPGAAVLGRYDVNQGLVVALEAAEEAALEAARQAWASAGPQQASGYRAALLSDVSRAYGEAQPGMSAAVQQALTGPGDAAQRAAAAHQAVLGYTAALVLRNQFSVLTAGSQAQGEAVQAELEWRTSHQPPDEHTCWWCRGLNGTRVRPGQEFPAPGPHGKHRAPRLYLSRLFGPPLHVRCRCHLVIVSSGTPMLPVTPDSQESSFVSSGAIRDMPEEEYGKLHHFLVSALHELGQILRRLTRIGT